MTDTGRKFCLYPLLAIAALAIIIFACGEDKPTELEAQPPEIPPASTLIMDFDDFLAKGGAHIYPHPEMADIHFADSLPSEKNVLLSQDNWNWSALHVGVWNLIITVGLAVPTAAFLESFSHQPELQPNGSWVWSYDVTAGAKEYSAQLHGSIGNFGTHWQMYITEHGVYDNFLWYSGQADLFLTEGTWTLNKHPEDPVPLLLIEWHRSLEDSTADIKYTNIEPGGAENGGYIFYGTTTDTTYDAFYDIYNKGLNNHVNIEWNLTGKDGRVRNAAHFGDEEWHCWDGSRQDVECP